MTVAYFDTSALVKLLIDEDGTELALTLWERAESVSSSTLAYAEVRAALAGAHRGRRLTTQAFLTAKAEWRHYWSELKTVAPRTNLITAAGDLAEAAALRGYGAVHLASALSLAEAEPIMVAWDDRLRCAASDLGLRTAPADGAVQRADSGE